MTQPTSYALPEDRYYHPKDHMWVLPADGGSLTVGIDQIELDNLGELAYIDLKSVGTVVSAGDSIGTLEAAKMTAEIFAPVSGTIATVNDAAVERPLLVNELPFEGGWLIIMEPSNWAAESATLISGDAINPWAISEAQKYQDEYDAAS